MRLLTLLLAIAMCSPVLAQEDDTLSPEGGTIELHEASARLDLGEDYAFYGPSDTRRIVVDMWGNPPDEVDDVLGLVMPAGAEPRDRAWGALVSWEPLGWVSSEDARSADYDALMAQMQANALSANDARRAQGFPEVSVTGWAQEPRYDSVRHAVSWGRELAFADGGPNALHYDLRLLGRYGVLSLNFVGETDQLPEIRDAAAALADRSRFNQGARYSDFDEERDEVAGYGVAGLVATGAGIALAKNIGLWGMLAKLAQPLGIVLLVLAVALLTPFRKIFERKQAVTR